MKKVVIAGGGWSGCAAAAEAVRLGACVTLLERTDMLLGTGLAGGIMRNNGRFTATEELIALGAGELFQVIDQNIRHRNIRFPGHEHADLYDIGRIEGAVRRYLEEQDIHLVFQARISHIQMENRRIIHVTDDKDRTYAGDVFIDATGTAGPMNCCTKYGNGCAMCVLRCPSFGGRVSLTGLTGIEEYKGRKKDGSTGAMSGSCKLLKESLSPEIIRRLDQEGVCIIPIPKALIDDHLDLKCCQQYALPEFRDNIILLDTGHAKLMTPYYPLEKLHQIPGFQNARYEDPYAGGKGNSMRYFAMAPRENTLKVTDAENLFCAGEKAGLLVGHTEAIATGALAGYNSVRYAEGLALLELPRSLAIGDAIAYVKEEMATEEGMGRKYTFSGSCYFNRMKKLDLYTTDTEKIRRRVDEAGLTGIFKALNR
ncbi:FAD-dependent oxidoreductase [Lachnospiraceae bacterium ASD3451]|uniref:FAD-dependent oxidoreductase n=1 Tax=Diplocloster agilis TaxID=2850323 RepID=UPI001DBE1F63|nr:FAD-dependent oxidoreductase [Diplocloster agilis]MBU9742822.1 FAD-dependent oxidoreductase [Diplocloster agilis]